MNIQAYLYWRQNDYKDDGEVVIHTFPPEVMEDNEYIFLREIAIQVDDFPLPTRQFIAEHKAKALREQRQKLLAETEIKVRAIDDRIQQLLALPCTTEIEK